MKVLGILMYVAAGIGLLFVDILSSVWLAAEHGLLWAIAAWVTMVPLIILPFFAGYGLQAIVLLGAGLLGIVIATVGERETR